MNKQIEEFVASVYRYFFVKSRIITVDLLGLKVRSDGTSLKYNCWYPTKLSRSDICVMIELTQQCYGIYFDVEAECEKVRYACEDHSNVRFQSWPNAKR